MKLRPILPLVLLISGLSFGQTTRPVPEIKRALIISIDGCRPDVLLRADTPVIHALFKEGSFTFWARTTAFAITLPSHVSMLTGVGPTKHEIEWNKDLPLSKPVYPSWPTLFEVAKRAGYTTALACGKSKFSVFNRPGALDWSFFPTIEKVDDDTVGSHAVEIIRDHHPEVMFVHFPQVDNVGHAKGWGTPEQIAAVENADANVGKVLAAFSDQNLRNETLIIITSDHGGAGIVHGPDDARSRHIPWIAVGPGIRKNFDLTTLGELQVNTEDTFATVCYLLAIPITKPIDGNPVTQILGGQRELMGTAR